MIKKIGSRNINSIKKVCGVPIYLSAYTFINDFGSAMWYSYTNSSWMGRNISSDISLISLPVPTYMPSISPSSLNIEHDIWTRDISLTSIPVSGDMYMPSVSADAVYIPHDIWYVDLSVDSPPVSGEMYMPTVSAGDSNYYEGYDNLTGVDLTSTLTGMPSASLATE